MSAQRQFDAADEFAKAYITTALWCGLDPRDSFVPADFAPETIAKMIGDCLDFRHAHGGKIEAAIATGEVKCGPDFGEWGRAGHDFWLTRNGHGSGFWDGDWPEPYAEQLSEVARGCGRFQLYKGLDEKIYGQNEG